MFEVSLLYPQTGASSGFSLLMVFLPRFHPVLVMCPLALARRRRPPTRLPLIRPASALLSLFEQDFDKPLAFQFACLPSRESFFCVVPFRRVRFYRPGGDGALFPQGGERVQRLLRDGAHGRP